MQKSDPANSITRRLAEQRVARENATKKPPHKFRPKRPKLFGQLPDGRKGTAPRKYDQSRDPRRSGVPSA